ncbi:hypothetical protein MAR_022598, partial [Mya arenaria]
MSNTSSLTDGRLVYTNLNTVSNIPEVITVGLEGVIGRFLWVSVRGDLLRLQMKEITVYGSCRKHRCGQDCEDLCYCTDVRRSMEAEYSGECMELCERNWRLYNGFCNT